MQKKKIVVTGSSGYIGRHVVKALLDLGCDVLAVDINYDNLDERASKLDVNIFSGSEKIFEEMGKPDIVVHLAWKDGFQHNASSHMEMLSDHFIFVRNLINGGLKHFVGMGSMHEVGFYEGAIEEDTPTTPLSYYGIAKNSLREASKLLCDSNDVVYQWLRAFYILGDDSHNNSIFSKICQMEAEGKKTFPFVSGKNKYDFLKIEELAEQIAYTVMQSEIVGVINCCSGKPVALAEQVNQFIKDNNFEIKPNYGEFPERAYDSPAIWGDSTKIEEILKKAK